MALKDQPYLPLYVQDILTDEKLIECSAESQGVYFRLLCFLHKQPQYGSYLLKQKYKQSDKQIANFATALAKPLAIDIEVMFASLTELIAEDVLQLDGDYLSQKRMIKDGDISEKRAKAGRKGGNKANAKTFATAKDQPKDNTNSEANNKTKKQANSEYEYENENSNNTIDNTTIVDSTTKRSSDEKQFIDKLVEIHCDYWKVPENNPRLKADTWRFIDKLDRNQILFLDKQLKFYQKIVEQGRFKCTLPNWMDGKWNEANYADQWGEIQPKLGGKDLNNENATLYVS